MTQPAADAAAGATLYAAERSRLLAALRHVTAGGVLEQIAHVGAASLPGLPASLPVELAITMWPFPLAAPVLATLADLGYARADGWDNRLCPFSPCDRCLPPDYLDGWCGSVV